MTKMGSSISSCQFLEMSDALSRKTQGGNHLCCGQDTFANCFRLRGRGGGGADPRPAAQGSLLQQLGGRRLKLPPAPAASFPTILLLASGAMQELHIAFGWVQQLLWQSLVALCRNLSKLPFSLWSGLLLSKSLTDIAWDALSPQRPSGTCIRETDCTTKNLKSSLFNSSCARAAAPQGGQAAGFGAAGVPPTCADVKK